MQNEQVRPFSSQTMDLRGVLEVFPGEDRRARGVTADAREAGCA
jgi:hypothetical protein